MTTPTPESVKALENLADRVEAAQGPDKELDTLIYAAINGWPVEWRGNTLVRLTDFYPIGTIDPGERNRWFSGHIGAPAYTASLDAAMALIPADQFWRLGNDGDGPDPADFKATVTSGAMPIAFHDAVGSTPALALTAAALRARAAHLGASHE